MRIATHHVSMSKDVSSLDKKSGVSKGATVFSPKSSAVAKPVQAKSSFIPRTELTQLALDLKNGVIDREEANRRFVAAVIDNSLRNKLGEQDREKLMLDIQEFFSNDQDFIKKLAKNLHDFA